MASVKGALIGCGFFAVNQLHAWREMPSVNISAICDRDPIRLKVVGDQFNISLRYQDAALMFAENQFDFVDIATTVQSHFALVKLAADHRIPVICQKPFALSVVEAKEMIAACDSANIPLMIHENFRWQAPIRAISSVLQSGIIGKPFWGRFSFRSGYDVYSTQPYLAEGERFIIEDLGIHIIDIARFLLGDVATITARINRINPKIRGEDTATLLLGHEKGATSIVDCSYATILEPDPFPETIVEIDGTEGTIRLKPKYCLEVTTRTEKQVSDVSPTLLLWAARPWHNIQESVFAIQKHFIDCLLSGASPSTSGADNLQSFALVEAAYRSAQAGATVSLRDILQ